MDASPETAPSRSAAERLGIVIPPLRAGLKPHPELEIEAPAQVTKTIRWDTPVAIGAYSMIHGPGEVVAARIGRYCSVAPNAVIGSNEHAMGWLSTSSLVENPNLYGWSGLAGAGKLPSRFFKDSIRPITIGHDVWIGQGAFIRGGVSIGDGAVIGSLANVVGDVPPYAIYAGNPARLVRYRFDHDLIVRLIAVKWWRFSLFDLLPFDLTEPHSALDRIEDAIAADRLVEHVPPKLVASQLG